MIFEIFLIFDPQKSQKKMAKLGPRMAILAKNGRFGPKWVEMAQNRAKNGPKHVFMTFYDILRYLKFFDF